MLGFSDLVAFKVILRTFGEFAIQISLFKGLKYSLICNPMGVTISKRNPSHSF